MKAFAPGKSGAKIPQLKSDKKENKPTQALPFSPARSAKLKVPAPPSVSKRNVDSEFNPNSRVPPPMPNNLLSVKDAENAVKSVSAIVPKASGSTTPTNEPTSEAPGSAGGVKPKAPPSG